jgi:hypothetical protein
VRRISNLADRVDQAFRAAGLDYRVVGDLATYLCVEEVEPDAGRLTKDIDIVVRREDMESIAQADEPFGLKYRHVAGVDMLVQIGEPAGRRAVHMVFSGEKVRPDYPEAVPELGEPKTLNGIRLIPLAQLVRMKLTSFCAKDEAHRIDLEEAGLITPDIEAELSSALRERLAIARAESGLAKAEDRSQKTEVRS